ncbi:MAG: DUF742 domain-containing protein [Actinomycetota bacterium]
MDAERDVEPTTAMVRPFLDRGRSLSMALPAEVDESGPLAAGVRAYAMTGGRSQTAVQLEFETMLRTTALGDGSASMLRFERGDVARLCSVDTLSVAELSARLHLPIGVVRVVAGDLVVEGMLESFQPNGNVADDVALIQRLIAGVRAL